MNKIKDFLNKNKIYFEVISSCMFVLIGYFQYQISSEQTNIANSQIIPQFILTCSYQNPDGKEVDLQPYTNDIITVQNKGGIAQELKAQVSVIFSLEKSLPSKTKEIKDFYVSNYYLTHRINLSNDSPTIVFYGYKNNERFHKYSNKIYEENIKNNIVVSVIRKRYLKLSYKDVLNVKYDKYFEVGWEYTGQEIDRKKGVAIFKDQNESFKKCDFLEFSQFYPENLIKIENE